MTVAAIIDNESDAQGLISWGIRFACAEHENLLVIVPRRTKGKTEWVTVEANSQNPLASAILTFVKQANPEFAVWKSAVTTGEQHSDHDRVLIEVLETRAFDPFDEIATQIESRDIHLLVLPARQPVTQGNQTNWQHRMFSQSPSEVVVVRGSISPDPGPTRVLVASEDEHDPDTQTAVRRASQLAGADQDSSLTLLFVRPDDDEVASQVAERHLEALTRSVPDKKLSLQRRIQLADSLAEGVAAQELNDFDVVVIGNRRRKTLANLLRKSEKWDETETAIAVLRRGVPMTSRIWARFRDLVRSHVPQIHREVRISLVDRLQTSSNFDFDFVALISLSTLIAALGLVRNSAAVVIGAMLIAPLMTPLVAIGFSLIQGNLKLMRAALRSVVLGFTVALGIGVITGLILWLIASGVGVTPEMNGREAPNLLDLIVALASGLAAAYAMGRPNLLSALPGVAIAAALVPPIATSGLALSLAEYRLFGGALLLFATNIIAIILGTAITFWAVGINDRSASESQSGRKPVLWPRYCFIALVIVSFVLATEINIHNPIEIQNDPSAVPF
jgi:uncharacterized hydrophobic protein (TIGR00271 family)